MRMSADRQRLASLFLYSYGLYSYGLYIVYGADRRRWRASSCNAWPVRFLWRKYRLGNMARIQAAGLRASAWHADGAMARSKFR